MTDRELLELAARAAGVELVWETMAFTHDDGKEDSIDAPYAIGDSPDVAPWYWNPLEDDGEAFRLAVKLGLSVQVINKYTETQVFYPVGYELEKHLANPYAATRLAVVRAAAEIGKGMQP